MHAPSTPAATATAAAPPAPAATVPPARPVVAGRRGAGLAIGLTEANAQLLAGAGAAPAFARAAALVSALHPDFIRIDVDWSQLQPRPGSPPALSAAVDGCDRGLAPCGPFAGLRDELRAVAAQQHAGPGWEPVVVIYGVPAWAAAPAHGCERPGTQPRSRPLAAAAIAGYESLIRAIAALGAQTGVGLHWWSAWNEPNHPFFISPQRAGCSRAAPALSPAVYTTLARSLRDTLHRIGGDRRIVLGELVGYTAPSPRAVSLSEFVAQLPSDVICAGNVWALHDYGAAMPPVQALEQALSSRGACGRGAHIWITETGAASPDARSRPGRGPRGACGRLARTLAAWNGDPQVDAAFQYSFREDPAFRDGLADPELRQVYPAYYEWLAWGSRAAAAPAPPQAPARCAAD